MCCICLEDYNGKYINTKGYTFLQNNSCYIIQCECNIIVHEECINIWLKLNNKCLICHEKILELKKFDIDDEIQKELKELYLFEVFILLILVQLNMFYFNNYYVIITIIGLLLLFIMNIN